MFSERRDEASLSVAWGARRLITQASEWRLNERAVAKRTPDIKAENMTPGEGYFGSLIVNVLPLPGSERTPIVPPAKSTIFLTNESPSPTPSTFPVK